MRPVLTAAQMRDADRRTIEEIGLPGAGRGARERGGEAGPLPHGGPVLCGRGTTAATGL